MNNSIWSNMVGYALWGFIGFFAFGGLYLLAFGVGGGLAVKFCLRVIGQ